MKGLLDCFAPRLEWNYCSFKLKKIFPRHKQNDPMISDRQLKINQQQNTRFPVNEKQCETRRCVTCYRTRKTEVVLRIWSFLHPGVSGVALKNVTLWIFCGFAQLCIARWRSSKLIVFLCVTKRIPVRKVLDLIFLPRAVTILEQDILLPQKQPLANNPRGKRFKISEKDTKTATWSARISTTPQHSWAYQTVFYFEWKGENKTQLRFGLCCMCRCACITRIP